MPNISHIGSLSRGHGGFPSKKLLVGSTDVFVNNKPVGRVGDLWEVHCNSKSCHDSKTIAGSADVFVNNKPLARIGDPLDCGDTILTGSNDVFSN